MRRHGERALWSRIIGLSLRWPGQQRLNMADGRRPRRPPERQRRGELQAGMQQLEQRLALAADARAIMVSQPVAGTYKAGDELRFVVNFDKPVSVIGTPRLDITIGSTVRPAEYVLGTGTRALQFRHAVVAGDLDTDGVSVARAIALPAGAAVRDAVTGRSAAIAILRGLSTTVLVDGVRPVVRSISGPAAATHVAGATLAFTVNWSERVTVAGVPVLPIEIGGTVRNAVLTGPRTGTASLTFTTTVAAGDVDTDGIRVAGPIGLPAGATIRDSAGNAASPVIAAALRPFPLVKVDSVGPSVVGFGAAMVAAAPAGTGGASTVSVRVRFSEPVAVVGRPTVPFTLAGAARQMTYAGGTGTPVLTFSYQAAKGESPTPVIVALPAAARVVTSAGATIKDLAGNRPVSLARPGGVALTATTIPENAPAGGLVGALSTVDADQRDRFTYALVAGAGSEGNASFRINGNRLESAVPFDFETRSSYSIRVRATDSGGLSTERQFTIGVIDVQERPPVFSGTLVTLDLTRISASASGDKGNGYSFHAAFSPDGTKVAFTSEASNLVPDDTNGQRDVFVRDLLTGTVVRVSVDAAGNQGNSWSEVPFFSPDGKKVGFLSASSNLVPGDINGNDDIFLKDLVTGAVTRVDVNRGAELASPYNVRMDPSGTRIMFTSSGRLAGESSDRYRDTAVFVTDLSTGAITRISTNTAGEVANNAAWSGAFSPDGSRVAFTSWASNLVPGDTNGEMDIFVKDLVTGSITRVSTDASGGQSNGESHSPVFSPDGGWLAFESFATNLVPDDTNGLHDVFAKNLSTGQIIRVSTDAAGRQSAGSSSQPAFSPDGRKIAFNGPSNFMPGASNSGYDIFLKDLVTGEVTRIDVLPSGPMGHAYSGGPVFSRDGTRILFTNLESYPQPGEAVRGYHVFMSSLGFAARVPERTATVGTFGATDSDPDATLAYSIGGVDAARFTVDPATGAVRFVSPPSAATPADANADNVYEILVSVTDGVFTTTVPAQVSVTPAATVDAFMEFVSIGDVGNAADVGGYGAVGYAYRMGKYEVTIGQYAAFLNAVAKTDTYGLWNPAMGTDLNVAGISRSGSPGSYVYTVMDNGGPSGNRPITYASWFDAARFANWMHNGRPIGAQGAGTTETGAYTLNGATSGTAPARNVGARFAQPTEDEWYKAAYYKGGSTSAGYWFGAMTSNSSPGNSIGTGLNQANFFNGTYTVTQSYVYSPGQNYLTDVGSFSNSASAYGTFDQSGNAFEWNDLTGAAGSSRGLRGGYWDYGIYAYALGSSNRFMPDPSLEGNETGFRLASPG